jgi:hypothetical protein
MSFSRPLAIGLAVAVGVVLLIAALASGNDAVESTTATTTLTTDPSTTAIPADPVQDPEVIISEATLSPALARATGNWATDWSRRTIDLDELLIGIQAPDPRDIIAPIDTPQFETIQEADEWLEDREPGVLLEVEGTTRFYPIRILTLHEIVNDVIGGRPVVVTYCPLCNTATAFDPTINGQLHRFGVSGLLRNSDLVMWDDQTQSLWQQITGEAIVGELAGTRLEFFGSSMVRWADFKAGFPNGEALSRDTGFDLPYGVNPYQGYSGRAAPFGFFQGEIDPRYPALERVVGVTVGDASKAFPFSVISDEQVVNDEVSGTPVVVFWGASDTADALDAGRITEGAAIGTGVAYERTVNGQVLTFSAGGDDTFTDAETSTTWNLLGLAIDGELAESRLSIATHRNEFWFAWGAFFPDADVYEGAG